MTQDTKCNQIVRYTLYIFYFFVEWMIDSDRYWMLKNNFLSRFIFASNENFSIIVQYLINYESKSNRLILLISLLFCIL